MPPAILLDGRLVLWLGDVRAALSAMEPDSVDCVVCSPPYWGLRDYGVDGQIGLERTLGEHIAVMVEVFELVRRVLKPSGTLWINYGDCYATTPNGRSAAATKAAGGDDRTFRDKPFSTIGGVLKPKDLCMVPNRLAIALQEAGWWVRSEIVWAKPNPMPESVYDRPATAHEKVFLLAKSGSASCWRHMDGRWVWARPEPDFRWHHADGRCVALEPAPDFRWRHEETGDLVDADPCAEGWKRIDLWRRTNLWAAHDYFYDAQAVRQGRVSIGEYKTPDGWDTGPGSHGSVHRSGRQKGESVAEKRRKQDATAASAAAVGASSGRRMEGFNARWDAKEKIRASDIASPRHAGHVNHTGIEVTPRGEGRNLRNYEPAPLTVWPIATRPFSEAHFATFPPELAERCILSGCPRGGLVLDIFGGAGTTALVALRHGRRAALIELNPDYADIARRRIEADWMGCEERRRTLAARAIADIPSDLGPLFSGAPS